MLLRGKIVLLVTYCGLYDSFDQCGQTQFLEMTEMNEYRAINVMLVHGKPGSNSGCPK